MIEGVHGDATPATLHGAARIRSYGRVEEEYAAATEGVAILDRGGDAILRFTGPKVGDMLKGVVTGRMPAPAEETDFGVHGAAEYHTVLTPKGKTISDLVLGRLPDAEGVEIGWALVPAAGIEGLMQHFRRFLPPRLAKVEQVHEACARITVAGPRGAEAVATALDLSPAARETVEALEPLGWIEVEAEAVGRARMVRSRELGEVPTLDLLVAATCGPELWNRLVEAGAAPLGAAAFEAMRIEAGTPLFGADFDDGTIPTEAGLEEIAIDHGKGCYTGQEVIVRIRDRGRVNRRLRRVLLGDGPTPAPGAELRVEGLDRSAGEVRSAAWSPRFGQTVAIAFVRREAWDGTGTQPDFEVA